MALTYLQLLTELAAAEGKTWDATAAGGTSDTASESLRYQYVQQLNAALRWVWEEHDPDFCWPYDAVLADNASVTVTAGVIALSALTDSGAARWCSLWTADPRTYQSTASPLRAQVSNDGVHVLSESVSTCFAFYRKAVLQGTWSAGGTYASPSTIPDQLRQPIILKASALRLSAAGHFKEAREREAEAADWLDRRKAALLNGDLPWQEHFLTL